MFNTINSRPFIDAIGKAEGLGYLFQKIGKYAAKAGEKLGRDLTKNHGKALKIGTKMVVQHYIKIL